MGFGSGISPCGYNLQDRAVSATGTCELTAK